MADTGAHDSGRQPHGGGVPCVVMNTDYQRVARAIAYLSAHAAKQPSLDEVAAHVHLSPQHFQRLFSRWAGTSPKRYLQALTVEHGKRLLDASHSLDDVTHATGLSGSSRLHDHFVTLEAVTPGEYRARGRGIRIRYGSHDTPFGELFVAMTERGICRAAFTDYSPAASELETLQQLWPLATTEADATATHTVVRALFAGKRVADAAPLSLHVAGTNFQVAVWRALLAIPPGAVSSYSQLASTLHKPRAARAVGAAIGANPVALVIPCHRVIRRDGALGGYRWGEARKRTMLTWEQLQVPEPAT